MNCIIFAFFFLLGFHLNGQIRWPTKFDIQFSGGLNNHKRKKGGKTNRKAHEAGKRKWQHFACHFLVLYLPKNASRKTIHRRCCFINAFKEVLFGFDSKENKCIMQWKCYANPFKRLN